MSDIQFTWTVHAWNYHAEYAGLNNVIDRLYWTLSGTDGVVTDKRTGNIALPLSTANGFLPLSKISPEITLAWLKDAMGPDAMTAEEEALAATIEGKVAPSTFTQSVPWDAANDDAADEPAPPSPILNKPWIGQIVAMWRFAAMSAAIGVIELAAYHLIFH